MTAGTTTPAGALQRLDETPPLRHRIHEQLESMITTGAFAPGVRLVEGDLAAQLGVSRGPIREALQLLWRDGFVDLKPRQGAFVHVPTTKEIEDYFDIRRALETESARLAAKRATKEGVAQMREAIQQARERLDTGDDPSAVHQKIRLHDVITQVADNPVLLQMLGNLEKRSAWYRSPFKPAWRRKAWEEHESIVNAIAAGDTAAAMAEMSAHIENSRTHLYASRGDKPGSS